MSDPKSKSENKSNNENLNRFLKRNKTAVDDLVVAPLKKTKFATLGIDDHGDLPGVVEKILMNEHVVSR